MEEILNKRFESLTTAFNITQYLRGNLHIFLDLLMTSNHKSDDLPKIYEFLHLIIKLIVLWLQIFPTTLLKPFIESQANSKLYLVDRNIALSLCGYELVDMLKWLFCMCPRTGLFFKVLFMYRLAIRYWNCRRWTKIYKRFWYKIYRRKFW